MWPKSLLASCMAPRGPSRCTWKSASLVTCQNQRRTWIFWYGFSVSFVKSWSIEGESSHFGVWTPSALHGAKVGVGVWRQTFLGRKTGGSGKTSKTSEQSASPKREPEKKNKRKVKPGASAAWRKSWAECDKTYHWEIKMNSLRIAAELHTFSNSAWPTCPARVKTLTSLWMSPCNSLRGAGCGKNQQCKPMREGKYALALLPWSFGVYQSILPSKSKNHHKASTLWQQQFCFCALPPEQTRSRLSERKDWLHLTTVVAFEHVKNS